jgi:thiosulfate/3-mercaptopyruvate sulfurtransferase
VPEGYARPEMLVETEWLASHLADPNLRVVDADYPQSYARAHIPGAVGHLDPNIYMKTADGETFIASPEAFAERMGRMGIGGDTEVVVYDSHQSLYAARFWWALFYHGHEKVRILNGGWHKWLLEGRPATMKPNRPAKATFTPKLNPDVHADCALVQAAVDRDDTVILDVRTDEEWAGTNSRGNKRVGHVPGAVHIEWTNFITDEDDRKVFRPAAELREMLRAEGITPDKNVYVY